MTETENLATPAPSLQEVQQEWNGLLSRLAKLESEQAALAAENHKLRQQLEKLIAHRQTSHSELVILLTTLVSKLPINDIGVLVARLVEHNNNVTNFLNALAKGTAEAHVEQPTILKTYDQTKRELVAQIKHLVEELNKLETPLEAELLNALPSNPEEFFSPRALRATRAFLKGQVPRERVLREFGQEAIPFFHDLTTDPKLNPRPKPEEVMFGFRTDFEAVFNQNPGVLPEKRAALMSLYQRVQASKASSDAARQQKNLFQRLSFTIELLHYYEHQSTENPEVLFAQRLPVLIEQLVIPHPQEGLDEKLISQAEALIGHVINPDQRHMIVNNVGKGGDLGKTLKFVLKMRPEKIADEDQTVVDFIRHLIPTPGAPPPPPKLLLPVLRLIHPNMQRYVVRMLLTTDRLRKDQGEALAKALAAELGLKAIEQAHAAITPEAERQMAWDKVRDMIARRLDAVTIAEVIRNRLRDKYDADEIRESWIALTAADPMSLIKIFSHLPYTSDGKTDPIARPVMETYVTRLTHPKYAAIYGRVVCSLRNMYHAKHDSPTLVNFTALVRWVDAEAANKLSADVGMPVPA